MEGRVCNCSLCSACGCWSAGCRRFMRCLLPAGRCSSCLQSPSADHTATPLAAAHNSPSRPRNPTHDIRAAASLVPPISRPGSTHDIHVEVPTPEAHHPISLRSSTVQEHAAPGPATGAPDLAAFKQQVPELTPEQLEALIKAIKEEVDRLDPDRAASSSQATISQRLGEILDKYEENKQICTTFLQSLPKELKSEVTGNGRSLVMPLLSQALGGMGEVHWLGFGITFIGWSLGNINATIQNRKDCLGILRRLLRLLENIKTIWRATNDDSATRNEVLQDSVEIAIRCAIFCTSNLTESWILRALKASTVKVAITTLEAELDRALLQNIGYVETYKLESKVERQITFRVSSDDIVGHWHAIDDAVTFLEAAHEGPRDHLKAVLLYGMGGIGKSTQAMHIFTHFQTSSSSYRACRVELPLDTPSDQHFLCDIQRQIIEKVCQCDAPKFSNTTDGKKHLEKQLQQISRYPVFVYVDNVLQHKHLTQLLPQASCFPYGSKLLITSRGSHTNGFSHLHIPRDSYKAIEVVKLRKQEAQLLLWKNLGVQAGEHRNNGKIASLEDRILARCDGLPLALEVVGRHISSASENALENLEVWCGVVESMEKAESLDGGEIAEIHSGLQFSIQNLNKNVKQAFLDVVFSLNIRWFYSVRRNYDTLGRLVGSQKYINDLCQRSLVQKKETGTVEIHDVLRALGRRMVEDDQEDLRITGNKDLAKYAQDDRALQKVVALGHVTVKALQLQQMRQLRLLIDVQVVGDCKNIKLSQLRMADGLRCSRVGVFDWSGCASLNHVSLRRSTYCRERSPPDASNLEVLLKLRFCSYHYYRAPRRAFKLEFLPLKFLDSL